MSGANQPEDERDREYGTTSYRDAARDVGRASGNRETGRHIRQRERAARERCGNPAKPVE